MLKIALVSLTCVAMLWTASAEAETIPVKWKKSGTLINQVQMGNPDGSPANPAVLIFGKAIGAPGPADIQVVSRLGTPEWSPDCFDGVGGLKFPMVTNDFAATLADMSMITATLKDGYVCMDKTSRNTHAEFDLAVTGGTERFNGASGELSVVVDTIPAGNHMSVETGTITGSIEN
jgi:hypothetical protein